MFAWISLTALSWTYFIHNRPTWDTHPPPLHPDSVLQEQHGATQKKGKVLYSERLTQLIVTMNQQSNSSVYI